MRVLLVEDNTQTLASLAAVLRHEQYDLLTAPDGPIALEMAKLYPPDVVLLDIGLPGMDGYTVAQELFTQVWKKEASGWKLARVVSYDHKLTE